MRQEYACAQRCRPELKLPYIWAIICHHMGLLVQRSRQSRNHPRTGIISVKCELCGRLYLARYRHAPSSHCHCIIHCYMFPILIIPLQGSLGGGSLQFAVFKRNTTMPNPKTLNLEVPSTSKLKPRIKLLNLKALSILRMPEPQPLNSLRPPAKSRMCKAGSPGAGPRSSPQRARKAGPVVPVHGLRVQSLKV